MKEKLVELKSGKKVVVKELSALEDVMAYRLVGPDFDQDNKFGGGVTVRSVQVALSVKKLNDEEVKPMKTLEDCMLFLSKFSKKEWSVVTDAYFELNEADDEGE